MDLVCIDQLFSKGLEIYQKCPSIIVSGNDSYLFETKHFLNSKPQEINFNRVNHLSNLTINDDYVQHQISLFSPLLSNAPLNKQKHFYSSIFDHLTPINIPFRFLIALQNNIPPFYLLLIAIILLFVLLRHRLLFWRRRGLPFESLSAHLGFFTSRLRKSLDIDDLGRVRRHGRLFGSFHLLQPVLCVADHQVVEQVLFTKADCFTAQKVRRGKNMLQKIIFTFYFFKTFAEFCL